MPRIPLIALAAVVAFVVVLANVTSDDPDASGAELPPRPPPRDAPPSTAHEGAASVERPTPTDLQGEGDTEAKPSTTSTTIPRTSVLAAGAFVERIETTPEIEQEQPASPTTTTTVAPSTTTTAPTTTTTEAVEDPPAEGSIDQAAESDFIALISSVRSSNGEGALTRDGSLDARARDWARHMAESGSLAHSDTGSLVPPWTAVAENVGQGGSVSQIFDLLTESSGHLSNMLGDFTHIGVGVWRDSNGVLWTAHLFAR